MSKVLRKKGFFEGLAAQIRSNRTKKKKRSTAAQDSLLSGRIGVSDRKARRGTVLG